jgi:abhydrolase domain-containing protein 6
MNRPSTAPAGNDGAWPSTPVPSLPVGVAERYLEAGGVKFHYLCGQGTGRPLLFLHGWPTWAEVWLPIIQRMNLGRPWFAPDLPCQGKSSLVPKASRNLTGYRSAIAAFVDGLGLSSVDVIGNSMGGSLALMLALDRPTRVAKAAVVDCAGFQEKFPGRTSRLYLPFILGCFFRSPPASSARKLLVRAVFHDPSLATEAWVSAFVESWRPRDRCRGYVDTAFALRYPDASVMGELSKLKPPVLVLSGKEDVQFSWGSAQEASRKIAGARFAAIEGAGHFPMVERPAETAAQLSPFLGA